MNLERAGYWLSDEERARGRKKPARKMAAAVEAKKLAGPLTPEEAKLLKVDEQLSAIDKAGHDTTSRRALAEFAASDILSKRDLADSARILEDLSDALPRSETAPEIDAEKEASDSDPNVMSQKEFGRVESERLQETKNDAEALLESTMKMIDARVAAHPSEERHWRRVERILREQAGIARINHAAGDKSTYDILIKNIRGAHALVAQHAHVKEQVPKKEEEREILPEPTPEPAEASPPETYEHLDAPKEISSVTWTNEKGAKKVVHLNTQSMPALHTHHIAETIRRAILAGAALVAAFLGGPLSERTDTKITRAPALTSEDSRGAKLEKQTPRPPEKTAPKASAPREKIAQTRTPKPRVGIEATKAPAVGESTVLQEAVNFRTLVDKTGTAVAGRILAQEAMKRGLSPKGAEVLKNYPLSYLNRGAILQQVTGIHSRDIKSTRIPDGTTLDWRHFFGNANVRDRMIKRVETSRLAEQDKRAAIFTLRVLYEICTQKS